MSHTPILIVAHAPLAHAFLQGALHVFGDCEAYVQALDIAADANPEWAQQQAIERAVQLVGGRRMEGDPPAAPGLLILTDVFGASPSNIAQRAAAELQAKGMDVRAVAGLNLSMLLRAITYRHEPLANMVELATAGGLRGVMEIPIAGQSASASVIS